MRSALLVLAIALLVGCEARTGGDEIPIGNGGTSGAGGAGGSGGVTLNAFPLPSSVDLGGDASAVAVGDLKADGYLDLAALVKRTGEDRASLVVAFGDAEGSYQARFEHDLAGAVTRGSQGSSSNVVAIGDVNGDGSLDVATASGVAIGDGAGAFSWVSFASEAAHAFQPAAIAKLDQVVVVRGGADGYVERCTASGVCSAMPGQTPSCVAGVGCQVEDLVIGDFDGDAKTDVLGGGPPPSIGAERVLVWQSTIDWQAPLPVADLPTVDLEAGDVDQDGVADVVARQRTGSGYELWIGTPGGTAPLTRLQTIPFSGSDPGTAALADASVDTCPDLLAIDIATGIVSVSTGSMTGDGCSDTLTANVTSEPALPGALGIQQLDVNGDGVHEWILRAGKLGFVELPLL